MRGKNVSRLPPAPQTGAGLVVMAIKLKITQVKSGVGRPDTQQQTLAGLGLRGPHQSVVLVGHRSRSAA